MTQYHLKNIRTTPSIHLVTTQPQELTMLIDIAVLTVFALLAAIVKSEVDYANHH